MHRKRRSGTLQTGQNTNQRVLHSYFSSGAVSSAHRSCSAQEKKRNKRELPLRIRNCVNLSVSTYTCVHMCLSYLDLVSCHVIGWDGECNYWLVPSYVTRPSPSPGIVSETAESRGVLGNNCAIQSPSTLGGTFSIYRQIYWSRGDFVVIMVPRTLLDKD